MRKFFLITLVAVFSGGCASLRPPAQYPHLTIAVQQNMGGIPSCPVASNTIDPGAVVFTARSPLQEGLTQQVIIFRGRHTQRDILIAGRDGWNTNINPHCSFTFQGELFNVTFMGGKARLVSLTPAWQYTVAVLTWDRWGLMNVWVRGLRIREDLRPRRLNLNGVETYVNQEIQLPTVHRRRKQSLGFKATFHIGG